MAVLLPKRRECCCWHRVLFCWKAGYKMASILKARAISLL